MRLREISERRQGELLIDQRSYDRADGQGAPEWAILGCNTALADQSRKGGGQTNNPYNRRIPCRANGNVAKPPRMSKRIDAGSGTVICSPTVIEPT